jgi:hypothetical protein
VPLGNTSRVTGTRTRSCLRSNTDPGLNAHVHAAIAKHSRRGWRLDKGDRSSKIDAVIALAMAIDRHAYQPEPVELLGWL